MRIAIACSKDWFLRNQKKNIKKYFLIKNKNGLNYKNLKKKKIKYIFFPHWSYIIPKKIYENFDCIIFHTGNLPNNRGGSPIQNLILNGYKYSYVNAIKVGKTLDGGPIYAKKKILLKGSLDEIFYSISQKIFIIMKYIIKKNPKPKKQSGKVSYFKRLDETNSTIDKNIGNLGKLYDKIRMLDSDSYPNANFNIHNFNFSFRNALRKGQKLYTKCIIKKI